MDDLTPLNQAQLTLLAQLEDIQIPDPIGWWPLPLSVWSMLVAFLGLGIGLAWYLWNRHKNNRYRREALAQLPLILAQQPSAAQQIMALNHLLKQVAITHYGRSRVSPLTGQAWVDFLQQTALYLDPPENLLDVLAAGYQDKDVAPQTLNGLIDYAKAWMKGHHK